MKSEQDLDLLLLKSDPRALVVAYQGLVEIIVGKYVRSGMFSESSYSDVVQSVIAKLLEQLPSIQAHYNGSSLLRTYVSAVIRNICLKLHKNGIFAKTFDAEITERFPGDSDTPDRYSIEQARSVFWAILQQFSQLPKLIVCLKLRYHIVLEREDILRWYPGCSPEMMARLRSNFGPKPVPLSEGDRYKIAAPVFNAAEGKSNTPDALRKWTVDKISEIITILNDSIPPAAFDEKTLRILVEDYFSPFLLKE